MFNYCKKKSIITSTSTVVSMNHASVFFIVLILLGFTFCYALQAPSVYSNGMFVSLQDRFVSAQNKVSENGVFECSYSIGESNSYSRVLKNFNLYENNTFLYSLSDIPGSSILLSNAGFVLFAQPHTDFEYTVHCYSKSGNKIFSKIFSEGKSFGFSPKGYKFGIESNKQLQVLNLCTGESEVYRGGDLFDISYDEAMVAIAYENGFTIYSQGKTIGEANTIMVYPRVIKISPDNDKVAIIDKRNLLLYSLPDLKLLYADSLNGNYSFMDLLLDCNTAWAGIHFKDEKISQGIRKAFNLKTYTAQKEIMASEPVEKPTFDQNIYEQESKKHTYPIVPWPFAPQDQAHTIWNNYEGLIAPSDGDISGAYIHNGLDIYCPAYTKAYAVSAGIVKFRGSILTGGDEYWRIATSEIQTSGWSDGWMYAHLVKTTIQVNVGDSVKAGDYLGQIYPWESVGGHMHFARIRDHGTVWNIDDDEWGLCFNPEISLMPKGDAVAPTIVGAITGKSKFAYCKNETSTYLNPDNLSGDIDIVVKLYDRIGSSEFYEPAFCLWYWIRRLDNNTLVVDTTLAHKRNHTFKFFLPANFNALTKVLYKTDNTFSPGGWFTKVKYFPHILTNDNADTVLNSGEKDSCFHTAKYGDGKYMIYVKASDCAGNTVVDSEEVQFKNGITSVDSENPERFFFHNGICGNSRSGIYFHFRLPATQNLLIKIYDLQGNEIQTLAQGVYSAHKEYTLSWDGTGKNGRKTAHGMYILSIKSDTCTKTGRMILHR